MIILPEFDPVALRIGPLTIRWYGLMYIAGFAAAWLLGNRRAKLPWAPLNQAQFSDLLTWILAGLLVGARLGYVLFYNAGWFLRHPLDILAFWQGGMSFHGGLIGVACAIFLFSWRHGLHPLAVGDFIVPLAPPGLLAGRIGNFLNAELWGRPSDMPWAMVFPDPAAGGIPRHPSQLYEALLEGLVLFVILWLYSGRPRPRGSVSGMFLLLYGLFRFLAEFFRQPDVQLGFVALDWLTMGQILCLPMMLTGVWLIVRAGVKAQTPTTP
ncbi:prolipoprotein diacylglyceryl transferase [Desulfocurvibacter africanus]|uniref:prolipoprotein diacylglyceryl transferase n=1 Tax=Desulfocurvibacter africanus TaxID=873 RepID=UPI0004260471|nr:prolipoprotein diacylglyceryl transferase [Desulfocurvibacter africanus]